jgi:hypothetical protein
MICQPANASFNSIVFTGERIVIVSWAVAWPAKLKKLITNSVAIEVNSLAFSLVILKASP